MWLAYLTAAAGGVAFAFAVALEVKRQRIGKRFLARMGGAITLMRRATGGSGKALSRSEQRQLKTIGALSGGAIGLLFGGVAAAAIAIAVLPWILIRLSRWQAKRQRQRFEAQLPELATGLANALTGGHAIRAALIEVAREIGSPAGLELARVAAEIAVGGETDRSLEGLRDRIDSRQLDVVVGAILIQRTSGGDLAELLREVAEICEDRQRLVDEARTASAQARFTGKLVVAMPFAAAALLEIIQPGFLDGIVGSMIGVWLVAFAALLQLGGAVAIGRIARVEVD